jgi:hypothetical protein
MATLRQIRRRIRTVESGISTPQPQGWGIELVWHAPGFSLGRKDAR